MYVTGCFSRLERDEKSPGVCTHSSIISLGAFVETTTGSNRGCAVMPLPPKGGWHITARSTPSCFGMASTAAPSISGNAPPHSSPEREKANVIEVTPTLHLHRHVNTRRLPLGWHKQEVETSIRPGIHAPCGGEVVGYRSSNRRAHGPP